MAWALGLNKATVYRALKQLEQLGYVVKCSGGNERYIRTT